MKKVIIYLFVFIVLFSIAIPSIKAETQTGTVNYGIGINIRSGPGSYYPKVGSGLSNGKIVTIVDTVSTNDLSTGCSSGLWYKINYTDNSPSGYGYACSDYVIVTVVVVPNPTFDYATCQTEMAAKGFPTSYITSLCNLKAKYNNWNFTAIPTGLDFNEASLKESKDYFKGSGLIQTSNEGWRSTSPYSGYDWETDTWAGQDGSSWKAANQGITAYYMDPRNFLTENSIFQFENLTGNSAISENAVQYALNGSFMSGSYAYSGVSKTYASTFIESGQLNNVNPVFLATRVKQEVGVNGSGSSSGNVSGFVGYYNFFNIGAYAYHYSGVADPVINGLIYAKEQGWDSPYKSITQGVGGTIINTYIKKEATTRYFQKFNVNPARWAYYDVYTVQYMTNIQAPSSEGNSAYNAYYNSGAITSLSTFNFLIPVFANMPTATSKPNTGNPNYYLKNLTINGTTIDSFSYSKGEYTITVPLATTSINIGTTTINANATVSGNGIVSLPNVANIVSVVVTAGNGDKFTYKININKADDPNISVSTILDNSGVKYTDTYISGIPAGTNVSSLITNINKISGFANVQITDINGSLKTNASFKTGDYVTITSAGEAKKYQVIIYGDVDGDGEIGRVDLLLIQRKVFGYGDLTGVYSVSGNVDRQGTIDRIDLLLIQRQVFGYGTIAQ